MLVIARHKAISRTLARTGRLPRYARNDGAFKVKKVPFPLILVPNLEFNMPFSHSSQISAIMGFIEETNPLSVLDVGAGMGQYGFLTRTNLENVNLFDINGAKAKQKPKENWRVRIDGIEGCDIYVTPVHDYCYDNLMLGDALKLLPGLDDDSYELVLAIDILEHFDKPEGAVFLSELKRIASRAVLISTPKDFIEQVVEANPYEDHRSVWSSEELCAYGYPDIIDNDISWIATAKL